MSGNNGPFPTNRTLGSSTVVVFSSSPLDQNRVLNQLRQYGQIASYTPMEGSTCSMDVTFSTIECARRALLTPTFLLGNV
jgi:hypothetical protein